jgi:hypothetical protein
MQKKHICILRVTENNLLRKTPGPKRKKEEGEESYVVSSLRVPAPTPTVRVLKLRKI